MLKDYIKERYGIESPEFSEFYTAECQKDGTIAYTYPYGFFTAQLWGDALVVHDIYTAPEWRSKGYCWALFNDIKRLARENGKIVIIGFSEKVGLKQELGQKAMEAATFKKAYETDIATVYMRGLD